MNRICQVGNDGIMTYEVTLTKPKSLIYNLHNLQGHLSGFQLRIFFVNIDKEKHFSSDGTIDQILGPRCAKVSVPYKTFLTFRVINSFNPGYLAKGLRGKDHTTPYRAQWQGFGYFLHE